MSAETRRISRERAKRKKKEERRTGKKIPLGQFERQDTFVPAGETKPRADDPFGERQQQEAKKKAEEKRAKGKVEVVRKKTAAEVTALEDRPGVTPPAEQQEERKWLQWRENSPMNQPVTVRQIAEATALGLGIAAGGVGLASLGIAGVSAAGGLAGQAGVTGARVTNAGVVLKSAAGLLTKETITRTATSQGGRIAVNTVTSKLTSTWLTKLAVGAGVTMFATSILKDIIGTYPFAGFLKEENIQQLDLGTNSAIRDGDVEGARKLIELRKEVLEPDMWGSIIGSVPYKNTVDNLNEFYDGARAKIEVDEKRLQTLSEEAGPTQPKWIQTADGNWKPNPENEGWQEQNEELVWMGG